MRILIATATAGGGHLQAAAALEEAWVGLRPRDTVKRLDILDFTPRLYRKAYAEGYVRFAEKAPELYAHAFRVSDNAAFVKKVGKLRRMSARWLARKFIRALNEFKPDVLLCPHFMPIETMGAMDDKGLKIPRPLVVCVVTDFEAHALWMEPSVDLYCVAMDGTKARLVARGVDAQKVIVTGIPVSQRFVKPLSKEKARQALRLKQTLPTLLVLGGGLGMGPLGETLREIDKVRRDFQVLVVAGKNEKLRQTLSARRYRHSTRVLGFVTQMEQLMAAADLIITKPGGLTTSEALALGRPMLIVNPLPGQEAANSDFLLEKGAAVKANRLEDLPFRLEELLKNNRLRSLGRAAKKLGRPHAAANICKQVVKMAALVLMVGSVSWAACGFKKDERVIFFPGVAVWDVSQNVWRARIQGWVFEPETKSLKRRALLKALGHKLGVSDDDAAKALFQSRARDFLVDNKQRSIQIEFDKQRHTLPAAGPNGHFHGEIAVPQLPVHQWVSYQTAPCDGDTRVFSGRVWVADEEGLAVISDIDDTIKISGVGQRKELLDRTFLKEFEAVPGMADVYTRWAAQRLGTVFFYVSASPWQLFEDLSEFLKTKGFPDGLWSLKKFRWKDRTFRSLFDSPETYKRPVLEKIFQDFPRKKFILVGDAGEKDPEIYATLARRHPSQVEHIYIRDPQKETREARYAQAFAGLPAALWQVFRDPEEVQ